MPQNKSKTKQVTKRTKKDTNNKMQSLIQGQKAKEKQRRPLKMGVSDVLGADLLTWGGVRTEQVSGADNGSFLDK